MALFKARAVHGHVGLLSPASWLFVSSISLRIRDLESKIDYTMKMKDRKRLEYNK